MIKLKVIIIKWLTILLIGGILAIADIGLINLMSDIKLNIVETYVASHDIMPRTCISEEDLELIKVPNAYIDEKAFIKKEEIVGKYTEIQGMIPKGSLFYKSMLASQEELSDYPATKLLERQIAYSLAVNIIELSGNTIVENQRVDIYVTLLGKDNMPIVDKLVSNARVLSIHDSKGYNVTHPKSTKIPNVIVLAVDENSVEYLAKAEKIGTIKLLASSESYDQEEAQLNDTSILIDYLTESIE